MEIGKIIWVRGGVRAHRAKVAGVTVNTRFHCLHTTIAAWCTVDARLLECT